MSKAHFGLIGLGVMGENLVLNAERNGFSSVVFNRTYSKTKEFLEGRGLGKNIEGAETLQEFVNKLERPRRILMMVKAGSATDAVIDNISGYLKVGDFVLFFDGASNAPTQSFNLGSNLFPLFAVTTAMAAADTSATLDSNTNFPASGFYFIQSPTQPAATNPDNVPVIQREVIQYTGKSGGATITGLSRGTNAPFRGVTNESTTATAHIASSVFPGLEIQSVTTRTENTGAMPATKT